MHFECNSADLAKVCNAVQRTVSNKSTLSVLEGILIEARDGKIRLTGYDMEVGTTTEISADIIEEGSALINAKHFCDILRMIPGENITIINDERNICKLQSDSIKYTLIGSNPEDYPEVPVVNSANPIVINQGLLKDMIRRTIFSVSTSERNPVHCGVKFEISENEIKLIAVDGSRLSIRKETIDYSGSPLDFVVPAKTLNEIIKLSDNDENDYIITLANRHICIQTGAYNTISRLLEGNFIDYKTAIPSNFLTRAKLSVKTIIECIERTSLIITDRSSPVKLNIENGVMKFSCVTSIGTANDTMYADIEGDNLDIGFNNKFILDALKATNCESININFGSSNQPIIIIPEEGEEFLYLVLPVRI